MRLIDYLREKYDPKGAGYCLSRKEADILGIRFPLKHGWLKVHGDRELNISEEAKLRVAAQKYFTRTAVLRNGHPAENEMNHIREIING